MKRRNHLADPQTETATAGASTFDDEKQQQSDQAAERGDEGRRRMQQQELWLTHSSYRSANENPSTQPASVSTTASS
eukprot:CAMPEP_0181102114 /NCGR_PEP_ID=MMETSP1071-20121207/14134_1 /TAXON_ID=35127 /ORGANISM="Thalassiosira sp., Strain NH16" /LENGTH=76 /DNA_ID=CAMNT_0023185049 /DNA_START=191 /DNA_END=421 /DNA_ORIENTATION=+